MHFLYGIYEVDAIKRSNAISAKIFFSNVGYSSGPDPLARAATGPTENVNGVINRIRGCVDNQSTRCRRCEAYELGPTTLVLPSFRSNSNVEN